MGSTIARISLLFGFLLVVAGVLHAQVTIDNAAPPSSAEVDSSRATPGWLVKLFPDTGSPNRFSHRLRRLAAREFQVQGRLAGVVTVELTYPGLESQEEIGQACIFLPPNLRDDPSIQVPLVHSAGYELNEEGAAELLATGYAVSTPHAHPLNPIGRGVNLDRAILHAVRRVAGIDPRRVSIQGGSAGGWMALMLAADSFPLVWAMPDVPPIHLGFNGAYIAQHAQMAAPPKGSNAASLPAIFSVAPIMEQAKALYGMPFESETFLAVSPLAHLNTITVPTLVTFSTADMLVPIDQVSRALVRPYDRKAFPGEFNTELAERFPGIDGKKRLLPSLSSEQFEIFFESPHENKARSGDDDMPHKTVRKRTLPFSKDKIWSVVVVEEGAVEPKLGHFKYVWEFDREPFRLWAEQRGVVAEQLTTPKLERLMLRFRGDPWRPFHIGRRENNVEANQLDYPQAERADVLLGLMAFAVDDACAARFANCYATLPSALKVLGPHLGDGTPSGVRAVLKKIMARN